MRWQAHAKKSQKRLEMETRQKYEKEKRSFKPIETENDKLSCLVYVCVCVCVCVCVK